MLREIGPQDIVKSVFTETPFSEVSDKYKHIPTYALVKDMEKLGWKVSHSNQVKTRKENKNGFQKHVVRFFNPGINISGKDGLLYPQVLLINSHDGSSSFQFRVGIYRLVCSNGLVIATQEFENIRIRHVGYNFEELRITINKLVENLPLVFKQINKFQEFLLNEDQIDDFTTQAIHKRFGENYEVDLDILLTPSRKEDVDNTLWNIFNRVQEKLSNGGFNVYNTQTEKTRKARPIKSFLKDIEFNQNLWEVAANFIN